MRLLLLADLRTETLLRGPLGDAGFTVETLRSPEALAEVATVTPPPAVILAALPIGLAPADFLRNLRSTPGVPPTPVALILSAGHDIDGQTILDMGVADIFVAPFQGARLVRRTKEIASGRKTAPPPVRGATAPPPARISAEAPAAAAAPAPPAANPVTATPAVAAPAPVEMAPAPSSAQPEKAAEASPRLALEPTPGPAGRAISELLEIDIELPSLPGRMIDLSGIGGSSAEQTPLTAPLPPAVRELKKDGLEAKSKEEKVAQEKPPGDAGPAKEADGANAEPAGNAAPAQPVPWPDGTPDLDACLGLLVAQTRKALLPEGTDEVSVNATWRSLSTLDIAALKQIGERFPDPLPADDGAVAFGRMAAAQLRVRTAVAAGDRLASAGTKVRVNEELIAQWRAQIDRDMREVLDPTLQRAVESGDLAKMKDFRATREALSLRRAELDRTAGRLRGITRERVTAALLDREVPMQQTARKPRAANNTRLLEMSTVVETVQRNTGRIIAGVGILVVLLLLNIFVFDTFHLKGGPQSVDHGSTIAGVERIEHFPWMNRVVVSGAFTHDQGLRELLPTQPTDHMLVIVNRAGDLLAQWGPDILNASLRALSKDPKAQLPPFNPLPGEAAAPPPSPPAATAVVRGK